MWYCNALEEERFLLKHILNDWLIEDLNRCPNSDKLVHCHSWSLGWLEGKDWACCRDGSR